METIPDNDPIVVLEKDIPDEDPTIDLEMDDLPNTDQRL